MFCTKCGAKNDDNAVKCVQCGENIQNFQQMESGDTSERLVIRSYLPQAILVTLFCCLPFGIPAIVYAAQVSSRFEVGNYDGAVEKSKKAKFWCWLSFWVGLGFTVVSIILTLIPAIIGH